MNLCTHLLLAGLLIAAFCASPLAAQEPDPGLPDDSEIVLRLDPNVRSTVRLAIPPLQGIERLGGAARDAALHLERTIIADLRYTGFFEIQDREVLQVLDLTGDRANDYPQYRSLGNQVLMVADIAQEGTRLVLESRVFDLGNFDEVCTGKRFRGTFDQARRIAHTYADEVVHCFTGERGISLSQIVFASDRTGSKEIFLMDYDGDSQRAMTAHESISFSPEWNPTGDGIAYVSFYSGQASLYYTDLESGRKSALLQDDLMNFSPSFSPDGRKVAFTRSLSGNSEIFVLDRSSKDLQRVTDAPRIDTNPAWSPSGREIAFTSDRSGTPQIYMMDAAGANVRRLTREGNNNDGASWHPDGTRIAYAHRDASGRRYDIAVVDIATLEIQYLTSAPGSHEHPAFSPNGRHLVFESTRDGSRQIWVVDANGSNLRRLTSQGENSSPTWSTYLN